MMIVGLLILAAEERIVQLMNSFPFIKKDK